MTDSDLESIYININSALKIDQHDLIMLQKIMYKVKVEVKKIEMINGRKKRVSRSLEMYLVLSILYSVIVSEYSI